MDSNTGESLRQAFYKKLLETTEENIWGIEQLFQVQDQDFIELITWIIESGTNPYEYLEGGFPFAFDLNAPDPACVFSLLSHIHHAMLDDGYITFAKNTVLNTHTIFFKPKDEFASVSQYVVFKTPQEFIQSFNETEAAYIKKCESIQALGLRKCSSALITGDR